MLSNVSFGPVVQGSLRIVDKYLHHPRHHEDIPHTEHNKARIHRNNTTFQYGRGSHDP